MTTGGVLLSELARVGVQPEDVDYVMCTHLHMDHIGWNTRLVDGHWIPTFPNAKYLISRIELESALRRIRKRLRRSWLTVSCPLLTLARPNLSRTTMRLMMKCGSKPLLGIRPIT